MESIQHCFHLRVRLLDSWCFLASIWKSSHAFRALLLACASDAHWDLTCLLMLFVCCMVSWCCPHWVDIDVWRYVFTASCWQSSFSWLLAVFMDMRKIDCFGKTRLILRVPSVSSAGKRAYSYRCGCLKTLLGHHFCLLCLLKPC